MILTTNGKSKEIVNPATITRAKFTDAGTEGEGPDPQPSQTASLVLIFMDGFTEELKGGEAIDTWAELQELRPKLKTKTPAKLKKK